MNITLNLWNRINRFIKEKKLLKKSDRPLLAVSGGPDSMMLLHYFHKTFDNYFAVFHLNHMIRKDSYTDEKIVFNYCKANLIDFAVERVDIKKIAEKNRENLEFTARKLRYHFFKKYARKFGCNVIVTAHNMDENVETVLLNLFRGTELSGLCGIPVKRKEGRLYVVRPLLCIRKKEIISYLRHNHIKYARDITNDDLSYTRNWIRHTVIPGVEERYAGFGERIIKIAQKLEKIIRKK